MGDTDIRAARDRIETVEKRIAAMQDAGVDTAALRAQLAFAHHALREGRLADIEAICDEVLGAARRLAELGSRASQVRTPAHGTPVQANRDPSTEEIRKVKIGRAQLAEEVRAAIDAEVKAQFIPSVTTPAAPVDFSPVEKRLEALESRLSEVVVHAADAAAVAGKLQAISARLEALEHQPAAEVDHAAIAAIVTRTVEETVPRQASELLREAIAKLPTRDDLHQIAETLRADLDWRLEKAAAEHGWCSLVDVQSSVRKAMAEQDPGMMAGGSQLGRLEIALAEFVQQSKDQQDRLIAALADKVVQRTQSLTKRMLVRDPDDKQEKPHKSQKRDTEELSPSLSVPTGEGSSRMAAITGVQRSIPGTSATEPSLDPVPAETLDATRKTHGSTTLFTKRVPARVELPDEVATAESNPAMDSGPALHDLVTAEVERALRGAAASTLGEGMLAVESSPIQTAGPESVPSVPVAPGERDLAVLVAAEVGRQLAMTVPVHLPPADSDLARAVARVLPQALQDEAVRTELFAVLALEAAGKPGVLGELTGLRRFLKRELQMTASQFGQQATAQV
jgi:hypothetical protein